MCEACGSAVGFGGVDVRWVGANFCGEKMCGGMEEDGGAMDPLWISGVVEGLEGGGCRCGWGGALGGGVTTIRCKEER